MLQNEASVQDQDSTTGRITLIITPKSDSNAHLINISIIIELIILLKVWESWEEWWGATLPRHLFHMGLKKSAFNRCSRFTHGIMSEPENFLLHRNQPANSCSPESFSGECGEEERKTREGKGLSPFSSIFWILSQGWY